MQAFVRSQRGWLVVERLPGYAPELNPVEGVWSNLKGQEFANYAADTIDGLTQQARRASAASVADHGYCLLSLTAPDFRYDRPSPYSAISLMCSFYGSCQAARTRSMSGRTRARASPRGTPAISSSS